MSTIADKLTNLVTYKNDIKTALTNMGVSVAETDNYSTFASLISTISGGGEKPNSSEVHTYTGTGDIYIAYISAESNGCVYTFYDASGNEIENPTVGTAIRSYKIEGTPTPTGSCKYYCLYSLSSFYASSVTWSSSLYGTLVGCSNNFGTGKANTTLCISQNTDTSSIFYKVNEMNTNKVYGYSDWFIPSYDEMTTMKAMTPSATIWDNTTTISDSARKSIWSSSEYISNYAWYWYSDRQAMNYYSKNYSYSSYRLLAARAF